MGLASLIGGMATTIGTSTNLLVVSVASDLGLPRMAMFDFVLPAAVAGGIGILFLWLVAPRFLPARTPPLADTSPRIFTASLTIPEGSAAEGKTLSEVVEMTGGKMRVSRIRRGPDAFLLPLSDVRLRAGDSLPVSDTPANLKEYERALGAILYSGEERVDEEHPLRAEGESLAEIVVVPGSVLEGTTLAAARFSEVYELRPLAIHRSTRGVKAFRSDLDEVLLRAGDVLLVQGARERIASLKRGGLLLVLDATTDLPRTRKAPLALAVMAGIVLPAALGILPIAVSAVVGVLVLLLTRCLSWREATAAMSAQVILVVVASLALGAALLHTGGAEFVAQCFVAATYGAPPRVVLGGLLFLVALLTNVVSNNAAAVIGTPIAVNIARSLGLPELPFVLAVLFGANMSFVTPIAYKTNLLVMAAGGYAFSDFARVGLPLTILLAAALALLLPAIYGM